ncbi:hypothetical protein [Streptacidiphilus melanogenes]|uniref:hypothetical protein n=1 Tax=Streptacidiphilus melanogenes TaxID=411235 RepID=UPI0007C76DC4|nr:hypothetical protein [Streptacidiphilus melanogenes]
MLRTLRTGLALVGVGVIGYGIYGLLHDPYIRDPADVLVWGLGGLVLHDGVWLPLVLLAGMVLSRTTLLRRPLLRGGLVVAAALTAVGLPAVLRAGVDRGNATLLPLPYLHNWLLLLGVVAAVVAVLTAVFAAAPRVPGAARAFGRRGRGGRSALRRRATRRAHLRE